MTDHDRLRELAQNATPGPWEAKVETYGSDCGEFTGGYIPDVAEVVSDYYIGDVPPFTEADAEFIAAANPQRVLALLDELATAKADAWDECAANVEDGDAIRAPWAAKHLRATNPYRKGPS